jgi:pyruvate dehydrogenase E1 component
MAFVRVLTLLLKHPELGKRVVPIIPDEARTFGMESLFRQFGIYASQGQLYKPHDAEMFLYYKESKDGQILEEGITEAGSMASFTAAGTAYANYGVEMIPFFIYYSMFGFQRVGDLHLGLRRRARQGLPVRRHGRAHHAGRRRLAAPGRPQPAARQHGSHLRHLRSGLRLRDRHHRAGWHPAHVPGAGRPLLLPDLYNENYAMPPMPEGLDPEGVLQGHLPLPGGGEGPAAKVQLFGSGPILNEALRAQRILAEKYGVAADVWSVTSYNELRRDALAWSAGTACIPDQPARTPYIVEALKGADGPGHRRQRLHEGGGRPDCALAAGPHGDAGHRRLRPQRQPRAPAAHFEINAESIAAAALSRLARDGQFDAGKGPSRPSPSWACDTEKIDPARA